MDGAWREIKATDVRLDRKIKTDGIHTYNSHGGYEVIDIKSKHFDIRTWIVYISKLVCYKVKGRWRKSGKGKE